LLSITIAAFAEPPGGGYNGWRQFAALFDVDDENGDPVEGVDVKVLIQIFGTEGDNSTIIRNDQQPGLGESVRHARLFWL
jgi:hypothetical protein